MDVGSPGNGYDEINEFFKNDDPAFPDDLDLDFIVNRDISGDYDFGDLTVDDKFHFDIREPEKQEIPSSSFGYYDIPGCPSENPFSSVEGSFDLCGKDIVGNSEDLRIHSDGKLHNEKDTENLSSSYFNGSIFEMDSDSVFGEVQNNVSSHPEELISRQQANLQDILDRPTSPGSNGFGGVYPYIEELQNELPNSECISRDPDEAVPVSPKEESGDPENKLGGINESRGSESEHSDDDPKNHGRSPELCKSPNKITERLGSPDICGSSHPSPGVHEIAASQPEDENMPSYCTTPSSTRYNQVEAGSSPDHTLHTESLVSASPRVLSPPSERIDDNHEEYVAKSTKNNQGVDKINPLSSGRREKSSSKHTRDHCDRSLSRSPTHKRDCIERKIESGPSANQSPRTIKVLSPSKECDAEQLKSSRQKHVSSERSKSRCRSKSPCVRDSADWSSEVDTEKWNVQTENVSASKVMQKESSSSRTSKQKDEPAERPDSRISSRSSSLNIRGQRKTSPDSCKSPKNPNAGPAEGFSQLPFTRFSDQKPESSETAKHDRLQHSRDRRKRSLETSAQEELSQRKKISATLQGSADLPLPLRSDEHKHELDDKSNSSSGSDKHKHKVDDKSKPHSRVDKLNQIVDGKSNPASRSDKLNHELDDKSKSSSTSEKHKHEVGDKFKSSSRSYKHKHEADDKSKSSSRSDKHRHEADDKSNSSSRSDKHKQEEDDKSKSSSRSDKHKHEVDDKSKSSSRSDKHKHQMDDKSKSSSRSHKLNHEVDDKSKSSRVDKHMHEVENTLKSSSRSDKLKHDIDYKAKSSMRSDRHKEEVDDESKSSSRSDKHKHKSDDKSRSTLKTDSRNNKLDDKSKSSLRSDKHKHELDDHANHKWPRSRSPIREEKSSLHVDAPPDRSTGTQKASASRNEHRTSSSGSDKQKSSVKETCKRKRSPSRSPCTGDHSKRSTRIAPNAEPSSDSRTISVSRESLPQPSSSRQCKQKDENSDMGREFSLNNVVGNMHSPGKRPADSPHAKHAQNNSKKENLWQPSSLGEQKQKDKSDGWPAWETKLASKNSASPQRSKPWPSQSSSKSSKEPHCKLESHLQPSSSKKQECAEISNMRKEFGANNSVGRRHSVSPKSSWQRAIDSSAERDLASSGKMNTRQENIWRLSSWGERKQKDESADRPNSDKDYVSSISVERKYSTSPRNSRQKIEPSSSEKWTLGSPKNHSLRQDHRRRGRSISPSHIRRKDLSSGCREEIRSRSRSRDSGIRSPRRRRLPRHRSPPSPSNRRSTPRKIQWSPPPNRNTGLGQPGKNLFVAGFSFVTTERDLERKFSRFGRVRDIRIVRDRAGESRGFGFLKLDNDEQADAAIRALDKTEWGGRIVLVEKSKSHF